MSEAIVKPVVEAVKTASAAVSGWKTIIWNGLLVIVPVILNYLAGVNWADYLNPTWSIVIVGAIGMVLRFFTTTPVGVAAPKT
jgi:hypothetical protein